MISVGAATAAITPPIGLDMEGYLREGPSTGVLDELTCQTVVFDDGITRLVLAACDLIGITRQLREQVCSGLNIAPAQIMLTSTHTHCGPGHLASRGHEKLAAQLAKGIIRTVGMATDALQPVQLIAGSVEVQGIAANRRNPDGAVDHKAMYLAAFPASEGVSDAVATIVNFACHATILDASTRSYSADFPGATRRAIEALCGGHALYLQGTAGDINPVRSEPSSAEVQRTGAILGAAVAREILTSTRSLGCPSVINPTLNSARAINIPAGGRRLASTPLSAHLVDLPVEPKHHPSLAAIRAARETASSPAKRTELTLEEYIVSRTGFDSFDFPDPSPSLPVQAFCLGAGVNIVGLPGEPFTATGKQIREASQGTVFLAGYTNQAAGYLPTREEFERGGLEVGCSTHAPGTAERLAAAAIELINASAS